MIFRPPAEKDLNEYYLSYRKFLTEEDMLDALIKQLDISKRILTDLPEGAEEFRYADGKWMIKEVVGHLSDAERILSYRALRFARNDKTPLPGFDENSFMTNSNYGSRTLSSIINEWQSVRNATIALFSSMTDEIADRKGEANSSSVSARILLYFILVHERHHLKIIQERYLEKFLAMH